MRFAVLNRVCVFILGMCSCFAATLAESDSKLEPKTSVLLANKDKEIELEETEITGVRKSPLGSVASDNPEVAPDLVEVPEEWGDKIEDSINAVFIILPDDAKED